MKLLIRAAMVFFATLLAAAVVALGTPLIVELVSRSDTPRVLSAQVLASSQSPTDPGATTRWPSR